MGMSDFGMSQPTTALATVAVALMLLLSGALLWRLFRFGSRALRDAQNPDQAFG